MTQITIPLPSAVTELYKAQLAVREHFSASGLPFTLDGRLVGDIGEALVAEKFGVTLCKKRAPGVDGHLFDGKSVQIKATGKPRTGPAFSKGEGIADWLIFVFLDFDSGHAVVLYDGPEKPVRALLRPNWTGTQVVSWTKLQTVGIAAN